MALAIYPMRSRSCRMRLRSTYAVTTSPASSTSTKALTARASAGHLFFRFIALPPRSSAFFKNTIIRWAMQEIPQPFAPF